MINIMKKKLISSRLRLVISSLLLVLVCMPLGCGGESKEFGAKSKKQESKKVEFKVESKELKVLDKNQPEMQPKKEINQGNLELSEKEEKQIEKRVLEIVDVLETRYKKELFKDIRKREDESKREKEYQQADKLSKELIEDIGKTSIPTLIKVIKDKRRNPLFRTELMRMTVDDIEKDKRLIEPLMEIVKDRREDIILRNEAEVILKEKFGKIPPEITLSEKEKKEIKKKVRKIIASIEMKCKILRVLEGGDDPDLTGIGLVTMLECKQLEGIGKPAIPIIMEVLKDKKRDWVVRFYMAYLAGTSMRDMIDNDAVKQMVEVLEDKTDKLSIRIEIAEKLGGIGNKQAVEPLIRVLEDRKEMMKTELGNCFLVRAIVSLGGTGLKDIMAKDVLIEIIKETMGSHELQGPALGALEGIGEKEKTIELALWMLNEPNCRYRDTAACVLGNLKGNKRAIDALKKALKDKKGEFARCSIVIGLGRLEQVDTLIEVIRTDDKSSLTIVDAIKALTKIGDKKAIEVLKEVLNDPSYDVYDKRTATSGLEYFNSGKEPYWFESNIY